MNDSISYFNLWDSMADMKMDFELFEYGLTKRAVRY